MRKWIEGELAALGVQDDAVLDYVAGMAAEVREAARERERDREKETDKEKGRGTQEREGQRDIWEESHWRQAEGGALEGGIGS